MKLPDPPRHVNTKYGQVRVLVLPWLQYIKLRINRHGIKYLFEKTSAGYPRIFSLGYYSREHGEIVLAKVGNYRLRYQHELGHANGLEHVWIEGDVMHPLGYKRGDKIHTCTYKEINEPHNCGHGGTVTTKCVDHNCKYIKVSCVDTK